MPDPDLVSPCVFVVGGRLNRQERTEILVIGAGVTGLAAALRIVGRGGPDVRIVEAGARPGGLLQTNRQDGVTIDTLPHVFFSKDPVATSLFRELAGPVTDHRHRLGVLWKGGYIDYPFQNHVHQLDIDDRRRVLAGLLQNRDAVRSAPRNLEELSLKVLGSGITDLFFRPYNEKLLQTKLADLGYRWLESKIRLPDAAELADSILGVSGVAGCSVAPHVEFCYPRSGGIETFVEGLVERVGRDRISFGEEVLRIDPRRRIAHTTTATIGFERVVSTLPIDRTFRLAGLGRGRAALARLRATRVTCVQLVLRDVNLPDFHWIYVPDPELSFYRLTRVDTFNPLAAPGTKVLLVECAQPWDVPCNADAVARTVMTELSRLGIVAAGDVLHRWVFSASPAYPVQHCQHHRDLPRLRDELRSIGIIPVGRFGEWAQHNMDHCLNSGFGAADEVLNG